MTRPHVTLRAPDGTEAVLGPGSIVGRSSGAALCIDDPCVSEAHALVSLRGGELVLLALRGELTVGRRAVARVPLRPGTRVDLVPGVTLTVLAVVVPARVLALRAADGTVHPLSGSACSVTVTGEVEPGYVPDAAVHLWASDDGWRMRPAGGAAGPLATGAAIDVAGRRVEAVEVAIDRAGVETTLMGAASLSPLTIVSRHETVHVHREDGAPVVLSGIPARIVSELSAFAAPVPWEMVARAIWKDERDRFVLRRNWDRHLTAMRARLGDAGVRTDLVRADGCGNVELFLRPSDRVEDQG